MPVNACPALVETKIPPLMFPNFCRPPKRRVGFFGSISIESLGAGFFASGCHVSPLFAETNNPDPSVSAKTQPSVGRTAEAMTCHGSVPATFFHVMPLLSERKNG